jgi:RNA polymerase sigma-32 factor
MGTTAAQKRLFFNLRRIKGELGEFGEGDLPAEVVSNIAKELSVTADEVTEMNRRLAASDQSLSAPMGADEDTQWQDMLVAERPDQETVLAEESELRWRRELLDKGMQVLNERERHILSERRLSDGPKTLEDLSQVYGVSRERIRQIEARAFEKLQKAMLAAAANSTGDRSLAA